MWGFRFCFKEKPFKWLICWKNLKKNCWKLNQQLQREMIDFESFKKWKDWTSEFWILRKESTFCIQSVFKFWQFKNCRRNHSFRVQNKPNMKTVVESLNASSTNVRIWACVSRKHHSNDWFVEKMEKRLLKGEPTITKHIHDWFWVVQKMEDSTCFWGKICFQILTIQKLQREPQFLRWKSEVKIHVTFAMAIFVISDWWSKFFSEWTQKP